MKIFWFDTETTGLRAWHHEAHQVAWAIEVDGYIKETGNVFIRPERWENVDERALAVSGTTVEVLKDERHVSPFVAHHMIEEALGRHVDKFDRADKLYPAGYNCRFDYDFLQDIFERAGDRYFGSWFNHKTIDPLAILRVMDLEGAVGLRGYKLSDACAAYGIEFDAHDALGDVLACRQLYHEIVKRQDGLVVLTPPPRREGAAT